MNTTERGFTLIELLVVITIVGVLASGVIFAMGEAKLKGADGGIKSAVVQSKEQAELYFNSNSSSYEGVCLNDPMNKNTVGRFLVAAQRTYGGPVNQPYTDGAPGRFSPITEACHDSTEAYVVWVPLAYSVGYAWCVDSRNASRLTTQVLPANQMFCPP